MNRRLASLFAAFALGLVGNATAVADDWHSEQPAPSGSSIPIALGPIYDIKFWAPNRGLLITAKGLWSYDGTGWHQLSTVCGGTGGRIAWAGPLDFWTISDQPTGQANPQNVSLARRSLCHFVNGAVVASYAQPLGQATSYEPMNAAACLAPDDCWFGGERLSGDVNTGAFHLHWDGSTLTPWPSLTTRDATAADPDRAVADMAAHQGTLYESVRVEGNEVANEPDDQPYVLHEIFGGTPPAFVPLFPTAPINYNHKAPTMLGGLQLSSDGGDLWAAASTVDPIGAPIPVAILHLDASGFTPLALTDPGGVLTSDTTVSAIAAEPGTGSAWVAYTSNLERAGVVPARLARVRADGTVDDVTVLPSGITGLARKGPADRVACPDHGQCWMATAVGWLFHLGGSLPRDDAPEMHQLINYRPPDAATPGLSRDTLPDDDSGIAPPVFPEPPPEGYVPPGPTTKAKAKKLVTGVHRKLLKRTTLQLTFTLTAKAHVQLVAKRKKTVVAKTKRVALAKGKHTLRLKLNARRWPTALDLRATVFKAPAKQPQAGDGVDSDEADDDLSGGTVTIASLRRGTK